ncbi:hypothetical protein ACGGAI_35275 [Streptomyces antibioticus]|uniref:hypothetical protein n=1 Tax=Streptomyces antibioticus TaxID=1890 RepID=UPI0037225C5B
MASVSQAAHNIEITAESLQEDLARLQVQKQSLERELAAVDAHLTSVQRTLGALEVLMLNSTPAEPAATPGRQQQPTPGVAPHASSPAVAPQLPAPQPKATSKSQQPRGTEPLPEAPASAGAGTDGQQYGKLTEQIMRYFAEVGDAEVRARDVAAALGRDGDSGSINGVRSTLDRLVGTSRVERAGRGLYRAKRS